MILAGVLGNVHLYFSDMKIGEHRMGFVRVLMRLGVKVETHKAHEVDGEMTAHLRVWPGRQLFATDVLPHETPSVLLGEIGVIAILAARARGISTIHGIGDDGDEVRGVLDSIDVRTERRGEDLVIWGTKRPLAGTVYLGGDTRLAMAVAVLTHAPGFEVKLCHYGSALADPDWSIETQYPEFWRDLEKILSEPR